MFNTYHLIKILSINRVQEPSRTFVEHLLLEAVHELAINELVQELGGSKGKKKKIELFLTGHFFAKQMRQGRFSFLFLFSKKQLRELFFRNLNHIFFLKKLCFDSYFVGYYSSQAIKLAAHQVDLTSSSMHKTYTVGPRYQTKTVENIGHINNKNGGDEYITCKFFEWNRTVVNDNDVMKLDMRFLFIFILRKQKKK